MLLVCILVETHFCEIFIFSLFRFTGARTETAYIFAADGVFSVYAETSKRNI